MIVSALVAVSLLVVGAAFSIGRASLLPLFIPVPITLTGLLILYRRPHQRIGWCLYGLGLGAALAWISDSYLRFSRADGGTAGRVFAGGVNQTGFVLMLSMIAMLLLLFPTGRPRTSHWRAALIAVGVAAALLMASWWFSPEPMDAAAYGAGVESPGAVSSKIAEPLGAAGFLLMFGCFILGVLSLLLRWMRAGDDERAQLKWFAATGGAGILLVLVGPLFFSGPAGERFFELLVLPLFALGVPISIAVAVLKYRLYDIDVIINRALVYAVLTAVLVGAYAIGVLLFRALLDPITGDNDLAIAASTLAVAALFGPARLRIQSFIDRRFYRSRYDAQQTLERFAARLRDEVDVDAVQRDLFNVISSTVKPAHASVWPVAGSER